MTHTPTHDTAALAADEPAVPRAALFHQIRTAVYRLALTTTARGRGFVTRPPLLTDLRDAVRPNQGGTGAGGSAPSARIGFDAGAFDLYKEVTDEIASAYESATDREPTNTPELLLLEWFIEIEAMGRIKDGLSDAQLHNLRNRAHSWVQRIEDHFHPPRTGEIPGAKCLSCEATAGTVIIDRIPAPAPAIFWTHTPERGLTVHCRVCKQTWTGEDLDLLDRFRWTQRRATRLHDLTTPLTTETYPPKNSKKPDLADLRDWRHIRTELRDAATKPTHIYLWALVSTPRRPAPAAATETDPS